MFLLDSLMISGIQWAIRTVITAAEAEMNDDTALREQLLEAEMRREMGEISDEDFASLEAEVLGRIREIKERREGGAGPLAFGAGQPMETSPDSTFQIEASVSGDFYGVEDSPHTTVIETTPTGGEEIHVDLAASTPSVADGSTSLAPEADRAARRRSPRSVAAAGRRKPIAATAVRRRATARPTSKAGASVGGGKRPSTSRPQRRKV